MLEGQVGKPVNLSKWLHEGTFTASPPFCASGRAEDLSAEPTRPTVSVRLYTCADGSGTITVRTVNHEAEFTLDTTGSWTIVEGTGSYARLRGTGTLTGVPLSGDPQIPATITFRSSWQGVVDFDDVAPTLVLTRATAAKVLPRGTYSLKLAFSARDDVADNPVSYRVRVWWSGLPRFIVRQGETPSGTVSIALRIRPGGSVRKIRIELGATDPVGNAQTLARSLALR